MYFEDQSGTNGLTSISLGAYDEVNNRWEPIVIEDGLLTTPPILLTSDSTSFRYRVQINLKSDPADTLDPPVIKLTGFAVNRVDDPRV